MTFYVYYLVIHGYEKDKDREPSGKLSDLFQKLEMFSLLNFNTVVYFLFVNNGTYRRRN